MYICYVKYVFKTNWQIWTVKCLLSEFASVFKPLGITYYKKIYLYFDLLNYLLIRYIKVQRTLFRLKEASVLFSFCLFCYTINYSYSKMTHEFCKYIPFRFSANSPKSILCAHRINLWLVHTRGSASTFSHWWRRTAKAYNKHIK